MVSSARRPRARRPALEESATVCSSSSTPRVTNKVPRRNPCCTMAMSRVSRITLESRTTTSPDSVPAARGFTPKRPNSSSLLARPSL